MAMEAEMSFAENCRLLLRTCIELGKPKNLFKSEVEDFDYEISPFPAFYAVDYFASFRLVRLSHLLVISLNCLICGTELGLLVWASDDMIQHGFIGFLQLLGLLNSVMVVTGRPHLIQAKKRLKEIQWPLTHCSKRIKAAVGRTGLYQSLALEIVIVLALVDFFFVAQELRKTLLLQYLHQRFNSPLVMAFGYLVEVLDLSLMCAFVLLIPHIPTYFATTTRIQVYLLIEYVKKFKARTGTRQQDVADELKLVARRYCEIKQVFLENRNIFRSAGIHIFTPTALLTFFMTYAALDGKLNIIAFFMHFLLFICVLASIVTAGQRYEDEWNRFYEALLDLPWYSWDLPNQKTYLTMLTGSSSLVRLALLQEMVVNHRLCIKVWKMFYSGGNLVYNLHNRI